MTHTHHDHQPPAPAERDVVRVEIAGAAKILKCASKMNGRVTQSNYREWLVHNPYHDTTSTTITRHRI